jgi:hypothetical protein
MAQSFGFVVADRDRPKLSVFQGLAGATESKNKPETIVSRGQRAWAE